MPYKNFRLELERKQSPEAESQVDNEEAIRLIKVLKEVGKTLTKLDDAKAEEQNDG